MEQKYLLMDRAYEGENVREAAVAKGFVPVVPPKKNRKDPWDYDEERYKHRNEIERYFLRLKRFRRIFTRYDNRSKWEKRELVDAVLYFCG